MVKTLYKEDMTGKTIGNFTIVSYSHNEVSKGSFWNVKCVCNKEIVLRLNTLKSGNNKSCGCLQYSINYMQGKKHNKQTLEKISNTLKGRIITEEWRNNLSKAGIGRIVPKEVGEKISKALKGKPLSEEHKEKLSIIKRGNWVGEKNPSWKGGITPINKLIRRSQKYKEWRKQVFKRDNYTCQDCEKRGGKLQADHIKPFALYEELRFEVFNGRTLCEECHKKTDTYGWKCLHKKNLELTAW